MQASAETAGLVGSYQGRIISALYSSSMGGHTESNEWIFNSPSSQLPGTNADPVLRGIYDGAGAPPDLTDPAAFAAFWKNQQPQTYDSCFQVNNRFSRWRIVIPAVGPTGFPARGIKGRLPNMTASGRVAVVRVTLTSGVVDVRGWDNQRFLKGLMVHVNELWDIRLTEEELAAGVVRVDVSAYLNQGTNIVQYNPVGRDGTATVAVIVD